MSAVNDQDLLARYVEARNHIDPEIRVIHGVTGLLAKLEMFERDRLEIDPVALGVVNAALEQSVLNIRAALDDFLLLSCAAKNMDIE